jgi:hypothetical protein
MTVAWNMNQGMRKLALNGGAHTGLLARFYYMQFYYENDVYYHNNPDTCLDAVQLFDSRFTNQLGLNNGSTSAHTPVVLIRNSAAPHTTLSAGVSGVITALPVVALPAALPAGIVQAWSSGGVVQNFTTTGAALSATSIPVTSTTVVPTLIAGNQVNGFGYSDDASNAINFVGPHWENNLSGDIWLTKGVDSTQQMNNVFFSHVKIEEDAVGFNAPIIQVDNGCNGIFFDNMYFYIGGFNGGYSTPITGILWVPDYGTMSNGSFGQGSTQCLTHFIDSSSPYSSSFTNIFQYWSGAPTVSSMVFSGGAIAYLANVVIDGAAGTNLGITTSGSGNYSIVGDINGQTWFGADVTNWAITHMNGGSDTSGVAAASTPTFTTATAKQLDTAHDCMLYVSVTTAITATIAIGPNNTTAVSIMPSKALPIGSDTSIRIPAGWWVKVTCATMADLQFAQVTC